MPVYNNEFIPSVRTTREMVRSLKKGSFLFYQITRVGLEKKQSIFFVLHFLLTYFLQSISQSNSTAIVDYKALVAVNNDPFFIHRRDGELEEMSSFVKSLLKDRCDEWGNQASQEKDHQVSVEHEMNHPRLFLLCKVSIIERFVHQSCLCWLTGTVMANV